MNGGFDDMECMKDVLRWQRMNEKGHAMQRERTSAEGFDELVPGELVASSRGRAWKDLLVQIFTRRQEQESLIIPAVPEPLVVWVVSGCATVEERELGGSWRASQVRQGDFYLTTLPRPTELRWQASGSEPFRVLHLYLGLALMQRAVKDLLPQPDSYAGLREVSGGRDHTLSALLEQLRAELMGQRRPSAVYAQAMAQAVALHLVRNYAAEQGGRSVPRGGLPAHKLHKVTEAMAGQLHRPFSLARLAALAGLSEFHFSRAFKQSTGYAPSRYFIRMRMEHARRLLRETGMSVIEVGLAVGYASPSHFAQVFRAESGVAPSAYRR
jgi:AraC family transcriptional regulator